MFLVMSVNPTQPGVAVLLESRQPTDMI